MKNKIDLEKIVNNTDNNKSPASVAFKIEDINFDLESIKEALNVSEKIFLQMGSFEYEGSQEELRFIFDGENIIDELEYIDEVYEKYKSHRDAGYGIYLDKDLNVEYGYYTEKYSNWEFHKIFHDFKNASEDDEVKLEIFTILANADIWITADISIDDFHNKCDLEKLAKLINWGNVSIFGASNGNSPVYLGNLDFDSFKEVLNDYDKIFLELGDFSYSSDDSDILIDAHNDWLTSYDVISDIENGYYDKYKFEVGGYGIYLDKDLNVEYGYYVDRFNYTDFHDFENARDDDKVKNEIYSILDKLDIWNPCEVSSFPEDKMYCPNCGKRFNIVEEFCKNCRTKLITGTLVNEKLQAEQEIKNNHIKELSQLDEASVMTLANKIIFGSMWVFDSKESILINMLKESSFNELIMMSKNIPKEEYMFFKSFNDMDDESAEKFFEFAMDYSFRGSSKEILLRHLLDKYSIKDLHEKLMSYNSLNN